MGFRSYQQALLSWWYCKTYVCCQWQTVKSFIYLCYRRRLSTSFCLWLDDSFPYFWLFNEDNHLGLGYFSMLRILQSSQLSHLVLLNLKNWNWTLAPYLKVCPICPEMQRITLCPSLSHQGKGEFYVDHKYSKALTLQKPWLNVTAIFYIPNLYTCTLLDSSILMNSARSTFPSPPVSALSSISRNVFSACLRFFCFITAITVEIKINI